MTSKFLLNTGVDKIDLYNNIIPCQKLICSILGEPRQVTIKEGTQRKETWKIKILTRNTFQLMCDAFLF
jgi:hypothetical protein